MNNLLVNQDFEGQTKKQILNYVFDIFFMKQEPIVDNSSINSSGKRKIGLFYKREFFLS
jgi:hypothetical protein